MACCAVAAWILGVLVRPFAALARREPVGEWAPPARWVTAAQPLYGQQPLRLSASRTR
jgi:hypothetical protein